jgi:hypothetical protein
MLSKHPCISKEIRKSLIIRGARQVGKSYTGGLYLIKEE